MWELGKPVIATNVKVNNYSFPLREGPVQKQKRSREMKDFLNKYQLPAYGKVQDREDRQIEEGYDPKHEVERILEKIGSGKKAKYKIKWVGSDIKTIEPLHHLKGCMELVKEFEATQKKARKPGKKFCTWVMP